VRFLLIAIIALGLLALGALLLVNRGQPQQPQAQATVALAIQTLAPDLGKPKPVVDYFEGCPPSGDGGDPVLNTLKNRIDEAEWQPTTVQALLDLKWPLDIEQEPRRNWSAEAKAEVARYEGSPVQVEGYLVQAKKMSPESCNCHAKDHVDFHIWLVDDASKGREQSVVIETTPRVMDVHPAWTLSNIQELARDRERVRISGWLLMDPEHPDQIGKTRGTIWEIHPVMQIEVRLGGQWVPMDDGSTGITSGPAVAETAPPVTPVSTATQAPASDTEVQDDRSVQITNIFYDGVKGRNEPDEYVEITNTGKEAVDITDWELQDDSGKRSFVWENYTLAEGSTIRVYTNERHPESGGFSFESASAIWGNSGDTAELYDSENVLVSRYAYGDQK
jgi:Lamin Tail Domain